MLSSLTLAAPVLAAAAVTAYAASGTGAERPRSDGFAAELLSHWCDGTANLVFSPHSLAAAMGMVAAGGRGETSGQIAACLGMGAVGSLPARFAALDGALSAAKQAEGIELSVANSLWPQQDFVFRQDYMDLLRTQFRADAQPVDYVTRSEPARQTINRWVADRTANRIRDLIAPGVLGAATRMTLVNAVYFKGKWLHPFDPALTAEGQFFAPGGAVPVKFMKGKAKFRYAEADGIQALELPYVGRKLSMLVLLPEKGRGVRHAVDNLHGSGASIWNTSLMEREVNVRLPKFSFVCERSCVETFKKLGVIDVFDAGRADLSGMAGRPGDLVLSAILHKAFVEVGEAGTEAAAATAGVVSLTAFVPPQPPVTFHADHPFVFLIREHDTGCILFMGAVAQPE